MPDQPPHHHTSACRQLVLVCRVEEHFHSGSCGPAEARTCGKAFHGHGVACFTTGYRCGFD
jgi:hypothetical protein